MKNLLKKLATAKSLVAEKKNSKEGKNGYSGYNYFTPEQVNKIVLDVCDALALFTKFDLKRNEQGVFGTLTIYDVETGTSIEFESATAIPEIKATNVAQQMGGCMTYTERYLKMTAFGITDNSLDFDSNEQTKSRIDKDGPFSDTPKKVAKEIKKIEKADSESGEWYDKALTNTKFMLACNTEDDFISKIKSKYEMNEGQEKSLRKAYQNQKSIEAMSFDADSTFIS